jgi:hypothetical protein
MFGGKFLALIQKPVKHIFENVCIAAIVRVGQGAPGYTFQSQMVPFPLVAPETDLDIAKTRVSLRLGKQEHKQLLPARKPFGVLVSFVSINTFFEPVLTNELQNLRKYCIPIHGQPSRSVSKKGFG